MKNFNKHGIYKVKRNRGDDHYKIIGSKSYFYIQLNAHTIRMAPNFYYFLDKQELYERIFSNYTYNLGIQDIYEQIVRPLKQEYEIYLLENREAKKQTNKKSFCDMNFSLE